MDLVVVFFIVFFLIVYEYYIILFIDCVEIDLVFEFQELFLRLTSLQSDKFGKGIDIEIVVNQLIRRRVLMVRSQDLVIGIVSILCENRNFINLFLLIMKRYLSLSCCICFIYLERRVIRYDKKIDKIMFQLVRSDRNQEVDVDRLRGEVVEVRGKGLGLVMVFELGKILILCCMEQFFRILVYFNFFFV